MRSCILLASFRNSGSLQTFQRIHVTGTNNVIAAAKAAGVGKLIYMSAIGSTADAPAQYSRTKAAAEESVAASGLNYVILRPSIILGMDGEFAEQISDLVLHGGLPFQYRFRLSPFPETA